MADVKEEAEASPTTPKEDAPDKTPLDVWRENVRKAGMTETQADSVLEAMMSAGYWEKELALLRGRLKVTLRTRDSYNQQRIANALDGLRNPTQDVYAQTLYRFSLAASLAKYDGRVLRHAKKGDGADEQEKAFSERLAFVDTVIPDPVHPLLHKTLINFDDVVRAALSEGAATVF